MYLPQMEEETLFSPSKFASIDSNKTQNRHDEHFGLFEGRVKQKSRQFISF